MGTGKRALTVGLVGLLVIMDVLAYRWMAGDARWTPRAAAPPPARQPAAPSVPPHPTPPAHVFTPPELAAFLDAATRAEALDDPLKRCLAYPDPPASHWDRGTVDAYCRYRNQPIVTLEQAREWIQHGEAAELDRRLGAALQAQLTQPDARGRLDRTFFADFHDGSLDLRYLLDAWKRASPDSAFAYAASGYAYVQMATDARGSDYASKTPQDAMDAMHRLMVQADADLQQARRLDPRITPVYTALIDVGAYDFGKGYALQAVKQGLAQDPASFAIYSEYLWMEQPQWFGSLVAMQQVIDQGMQQAERNPLLRLDRPQLPAYLANINDCCGRPAQIAQFPAVFDQLADSSSLSLAGNTATDHGQRAVGTVYLAEALRFNPGYYDNRRRFAQLVSSEGKPQLLMLLARQLVAARPDDPDALALRGLAALQQGDVPHGRTDLAHALVKRPDNPALLSLLGRVYVYDTHEWDKGWTLADRLVQERPDLPDGWRLRASIQLHQPRAGLDDTLHYFILHFGNDPRQKGVVKEMERMLEAEAKGGPDPLAAFRGPRSVPARAVMAGHRQ